MKIQIIQNRFSLLGDRTFPMLAINGELDLYSAGYLVRMINQGAKPGTIENHAKGIMALYRFCHHENINLPDRLRKLDNLRLPEIEALSTWLSVKDRNTGELNSDGTHKLRLFSVKTFILSFWDTYQSRASNNAENLNHARHKREVMTNAFKVVEDTPFTRSGRNLQGLKPELKAKFMQIINPLKENDLNPFKSEHVRWRNYILCLTMILGGNRRSESVLLKLQDVNLYGREKYFEIVKDTSPLPARSPHARAPSVKTLGRKIPLTDDLAVLFEYYIRKVRPKFLGHAKSIDLFLSIRGGQPLSVNTPNKVLEVIVQHFPEFKGHLTPHRLRNTFHDMLSDSLDDMLDETLGNESPMMKHSQKSVLQEHAGGWSRGSKMTSKYPAGAIERRVMKIAEKAQARALAEANDDKGNSSE